MTSARSFVSLFPLPYPYDFKCAAKSLTVMICSWRIRPADSGVSSHFSDSARCGLLVDSHSALANSGRSLYSSGPEEIVGRFRRGICERGEWDGVRRWAKYE